MSRGPQTLTWSFPVRKLLLSYVSEHTAAVWWGSRHRGGPATGTGSNTVLPSIQPCTFSLHWGNCHYLRGVSFQQLISRASLSSPCQTPQVIIPAKPKAVLRKPVTREDLWNNIYHDCLINTKCLRARRRLIDFHRASFSLISKTRINLPHSRVYHRQHLAGLSTHTSHMLSHLYRRPPAANLPLQQIRAVGQGFPRLVDDWRGCLSLENENRCRQSLGPNLKLCEMAWERRGAGQGPEKKQETWASVLVSLCSVKGQPAFLFTLRSRALNRNKGEVSFAGGKVDPSDRDVVATALRETREELGINVAPESVWGVFRPFKHMTGMTIVPVLANLGPIEELSFKPNPEEVDEIFTLPLSHLCNPKNYGYTNFRLGGKYGYTCPVFYNGKYRVWGLTAIVLDRTLKLIVPLKH